MPHSPATLSPPGPDPWREVEVLRKKVKFLQHIGTIFRQKIGTLFKEAAANGDVQMQQLDRTYRRLVAELPNSDTGPLVSPTRLVGDVAPDTAEGQYWHGKFMSATRKMKSMLEGSNSCENQLADDIRLLQEKLTQSEMHNRFLEEQLHATKNIQQTMSMGYPTTPMGLSRGAGGLSPPIPLTAPTPPPPMIPSVFPSAKETLHPQLLDPQECDTATTLVIRSMQQDNMQLSHQLNEALERVHTVDTLQQEVSTLQKQNSLLRNRLMKMKESQKQSKIESSTTAVEMQTNIHTLLGSLNDANAEIASKEAQMCEIATSKGSLLQDMQLLQAATNHYKERIAELERENLARLKTEQLKQQETNQESKVLYEQVSEKNQTVTDMSDQLGNLNNQVEKQYKTLKENTYHIELLNIEKMTLQEKVHHMDLLMSERKHFGNILGEVQSRLGGAVDDLKIMSTTREVADRVKELNNKVGGLEILESQLRQKDDLLAMKDDEVLKLQNSIKSLEQNVDSISSVFLKLPKSLEEMEQIIIERDTFKEAMVPEAAAEAHEDIAIKLIELESKRKSNPTPEQALADGGVAGLAAAAMQVLSNHECDSDDELLEVHQSSSKERSASTLGRMYESIYGNIQRVSLPPPPAYSFEQDSPPPGESQVGHFIQNQSPHEIIAPPVHQLEGNQYRPSVQDIQQAFSAFEHQGSMDKDHFRTCVLVLGLNVSKPAEEFLSFQQELDFESFKAAVDLC